MIILKWIRRWGGWGMALVFDSILNKLCHSFLNHSYSNLRTFVVPSVVSIDVCCVYIVVETFEVTVHRFTHKLTLIGSTIVDLWVQNWHLRELLAEELCVTLRLEWWLEKRLHRHFINFYPLYALKPGMIHDFLYGRSGIWILLKKLR